MFVHVNGAKLYFDVEGAGLVPSDLKMKEKPTLLLLHGGPGADHSIFKPTFSALSDIAQVVYFDHRGNGRSEDGSPETWTLAQWGKDVKVCVTLSASTSQSFTVHLSVVSLPKLTRRSFLTILQSSS